MNIIDHIINSYSENKSAASYKKFLLKLKLAEILYKEGQKTISELCDATNNSIPSLTAVLNELAHAGWIINYGIGESRGGRKPAMYGLNPGAGFIMGIELSRDFSRLCIFNLFNQSLGDLIEINEGLDTTKEILSVLKKESGKLLKKQGIKNEQVIGYGITIPGLIDIKTGVSYSYPQLGSGNLNLLFTELFGRPSFVEHDTKSMVLGESWFGLAKKMSDVLFLNIGAGIGMGIIINGNLYNGHSGFSGEFGHIQMIPNGDLCYCGKIGCLETVASGTALVKKAKEEIKKGKSSILSSKVNNNLDEIKLVNIIVAAKQGDHFALELLEEASEQIARGISTLLHLFNPEAIIIGGELAETGTLLLDTIQHKLNKYAMLKLKQDTQLILSELHQSAGLLGAIPVVMSKAFFVPRDLE
jgi:N-acetylglucosamine repressor